MVFEPAVSVNVLDIETKIGEIPGDQNCTMTFKRFLLGTHQRDPIFFHPFLYAVQTLSEKIGVRQAFILDLAILVACRVFAARAEFRAQKDVSNAAFPQGLFQFLAVELRVHPAVRLRAYVARRRNAMPRKKTDEVLLAMRGVANC